MNEFECLYSLDEIVKKSKNDTYDFKKDLAKVLFANIAGFALAILLQEQNGKTFDAKLLLRMATIYTFSCIPINNKFIDEYRKYFYKKQKKYDQYLEDVIGQLKNMGIHIRKEDFINGITKECGNSNMIYFFDMFDKIKILEEQHSTPDSKFAFKYRPVTIRIEEPVLTQLGTVKTNKDGTSKLINKEGINDGEFITTYYELKTGKNKFSFYVNNNDIKIINIEGFSNDTNELNNYLMLGIALQNVGFDTSLIKKKINVL